MSFIWPTIPFCFSLKFCHDNTAVTTPNAATVATHSATKEAMIEMRTPEWGSGGGGMVIGGTESSSICTVGSIQFHAWDNASISLL